jgi:hypothetical protein
VLDEELQKKIVENACLLSMVGVCEAVSKVGCTNKANKMLFPFNIQ